jgi:transposase
MDARVKALTIDKLYALIKTQAATILRLEQEVAELKRRLGLNRGHSSKPPSSDGLKQPARVKSLRERSGKPSGGQPGHRGETLRQLENPDIIKQHKAMHCVHCRKKLTEARVTGVMKRQGFDIAEPCLEVTEHQASISTCLHCNGITQAAFPEDLISAAQYGPGVRAVALYLNCGQLIPEARVAQTMGDLFNLNLCPAMIAGMGVKKASALKPVGDTIVAQVAAAPVKHLDATGFRIGSRTQWLQVAATLGLSSYRVSAKRHSLPSMPTGIVTHDHWQPYFTLSGVKHALCNAHHLRELKALIEIEQEPGATCMYAFLLKACRTGHRAWKRDTEALSGSTQRPMRGLYDKIMAPGLAFHRRKPPLLKTGVRGRRPRRTG